MNARLNPKKIFRSLDHFMLDRAADMMGVQWRIGNNGEGRSFRYWHCELRKLSRRCLFDFGVKTVSVRIHGDYGREVLHLDVQEATHKIHHSGFS